MKLDHELADQLVELEEENRELRKQIESLQTELKLLREALDENHEHTTKRD